MPQQSKAKWARLKVGLLAVGAMIVVAALVFLITGHTNPFAGKTSVFTFMDDSASLSEGAPVNLNGIPIGKVKRIDLSGSRESGRAVKFDLEIPVEELKKIPSDSVAAIGAPNVLGTKFINITMGKSSSPVRPGQELPALKTVEFEDLVKQGYPLLTSLQGIIDRLDKIVGQVENGKGSIGKLLVDETLYKHVLAIVDSVGQLASALNSDKGTLGKLIYDTDMYTKLEGTLGRVDSLLQDLQGGKGAAGKFLKDPALYDESQKTVAEIRKLAEDLNAGKGTAGKLLKSDELHQRLLVTMGKIDTIMDKVNAGQGTIGQLLVNQQLYDNMNGSTRELQGLMKDFRANPKKFLRIKLALF